jgi:hypothetical protein
MSSAGKLDLFIDQGSTFSFNIKIQDSKKSVVDLTGYTARMQIRRTLLSQDFIIELTTENGRISIDAENGSITLTIDASDTAEFNFFTAVYDLEIESSGGIVTRIVQGKVTLSKEVTR